MSASLHHVSPLLRSFHKLHLSQGFHLRGDASDSLPFRAAFLPGPIP